MYETKFYLAVRSKSKYNTETVAAMAAEKRQGEKDRRKCSYETSVEFPPMFRTD